MKTSKLMVMIGALAVGAAAGFWAGRQSPAGAAPAAAQPAGAARPLPTGGPTASAAPAPTSAEAAAAGVTLDSLLRGAGRPDAELLALWAKGLSPKDCSAALAALKDLPPGLQRDALLGAVVNAWAGRDAQGFLAAAGSVPIPRLREEGVSAALKAWAAQNPKDALEWFKANPGSASSTALQARYAALIGGMAANDPKAAFETVTALGDGTLRDRQMKSAALRSLSDALAEEGKFTDAFAMFGTLPAGGARDDAYNRLIQRWAEASPQEASAWVSNLTDPELRAQVGPRLAESWAASDPLGAAAWAAQMDAQLAQAATAAGTPNPNDGQLLANAIRSWASYDLDAPAQFLNEMAASPTKDRAVSIFALRAAQEDPAGAMEWVTTISDEQTRTGLTMGVAFQWMQQDPGTFNQFVASTQLLSDQQKQVLQSIPPNVVENMNRFNNMMGGGDAMQRLMENMIINGGGEAFGGRGGGGPFGGGRRGGPGGPGGGGN